MKTAVATTLLSLLSVSQIVSAVNYYPNLHAEFAVKVQSQSGSSDPVAAASNVSTWVQAKTADIPIDHNGSINGTFKNRYWVYEGYYKPGAPVFIFDGGEADLESGAKYWLASNKSFFNELLREFNGLGIAWEHRYYGASTPYVIDGNTTPQQMQYLTTAQALADVPYFANSFKSDNFSTIDLTPKNTPWIFVGGSYPGMRATFMREKYPDTIFASWASSAPVEARKDMGVYFEQIYRGMQYHGFGNCTKNIQSALNYIDGQMGKSDETAAAIKDYFLGVGGANNSNAGFADTLSTVYFNWQNEGMGAHDQFGLQPFCDWISSDESGNFAPAQGWESEKGMQWIAERWAKYPQFAPMIQTYGIDCGGHGSNDTTHVCDLDTVSVEGDGASWTWQFCTEWGFFQQANFGPNRIVSRYNNLDHQQDYCNRSFPAALKAGILPSEPQVHRTNRIYGGWRNGGLQSRTMYTGGQFDPWRTLSFLSTEPFAPNNIKVSSEIPGCNDKTTSDQVFGYQLTDAEHCFDMDISFPDSKNPRAMFAEALKTWLPCYQPQK